MAIARSHVDKVISELRIREKLELLRTQKCSKAAVIDIVKTELKLVPPKIDYAPQIPFVRHQGAYACGMNAAAAGWDVMNEQINPYSPNLSVNRMIWVWAQELRRDQVFTLLTSIGQQPQSIQNQHWQQAYGVDDYQRFLMCVPGLGKSYQSSFEYFADLGCPTEGTELTDSDAVKWPTAAGNDEAKNYRQKLISTPSAPGKTCWVPVKVDLNNLRYHLSTKPLRAVVFDGTHFVALIGYDDAKQRFKFINSYGDRWNDHGYSYIPYSKVGQEVQGAEYLLVETPKPAPTARVSFKHSRRQNVSVFLYGKQSTGAPAVKQIWPSGQRQDDSGDLTLTVTLPVGFVWPPSTNNKLYLQVFDNGATAGGGDLVEFTAAFSGSVLTCKKLKTGAAHFSANTLATFSIS